MLLAAENVTDVERVKFKVIVKRVMMKSLWSKGNFEEHSSGKLVVHFMKRIR